MHNFTRCNRDCDISMSYWNVQAPCLGGQCHSQRPKPATTTPALTWSAVVPVPASGLGSGFRAGQIVGCGASRHLVAITQGARRAAYRRRLAGIAGREVDIVCEGVAGAGRLLIARTAADAEKWT